MYLFKVYQTLTDKKKKKKCIRPLHDLIVWVIFSSCEHKLATSPLSIACQTDKQGSYNIPAKIFYAKECFLRVALVVRQAQIIVTGLMQLYSETTPICPAMIFNSRVFVWSFA